MSLYYPTLADKKRTGYRFLSWVSDQSLYHPGEDMNNGFGNDDLGQEVVSPTWGIVQYVSEISANGGLGGYMVISHPHNNGHTRYMHLNEITVHTGETVYPQQIIGRLGKTGNAQSAHLHFEVLNDNGLIYIQQGVYPFGRYTKGLTKSQVASLWKDPRKWLEEEDHYVGPSVNQRLNAATNAIKYPANQRQPRKNTLLRLIDRLTALLGRQVIYE